MDNNINVQKEQAKMVANQLMTSIQKMQNILHALSDNVSAMTWSGSNATKFKATISKHEEELNVIYTSYISKIPEKIEQSIANYQKYEG